MSRPAPKSIGPWRILLRKLRKNRVATTGLMILFLLYSAACFAGFFSPYHYAESNQYASFAGPMLLGSYEHVSYEVEHEIDDERLLEDLKITGKTITAWRREWRWFSGGIHFHDSAGNFTLRPHVHPLVQREYFDRFGDRDAAGVASDRTRSIPISFFIKSEAPHEVASLCGFMPIEGSRRLFGIAPEDRAAAGTFESVGVHLLGTDQRGRDILSRLFYGAQISMSVGILGILVSMSLAMIMGGIAGYFGGIYDFTLMRSVEIIMAIPGLYLILTLRYILPPNLSSRQTYLLIVLILAFVGWAANSRVIRGMVLSIRENDYIVASRALGQKSIWIILRHILPNAISYVIVTSTLYIPYYILSEVALSFLGLGIQDPEASWGNMLRDAQEAPILVRYPWLIMPGVAVFVAVLAFNFLGDGLRDAADPRAVVSRDGVREEDGEGKKSDDKKAND